jgi:hypothetical protein
MGTRIQLCKIDILDAPKWHYFVSTCKCYTLWQPIGSGGVLEFNPLYYFEAF